MSIEIYHNPRCRKSRKALELLEKNAKDFIIIEYLKDVPSKDQLRDVIKKLNIKASDLIRTTEAIYKENYKGKELSEDEWLDAMITHPKLIQRPIVLKDDKAVVGRPPELVLDILN